MAGCAMKGPLMREKRHVYFQRSLAGSTMHLYYRNLSHMHLFHLGNPRRERERRSHLSSSNSLCLRSKFVLGAVERRKDEFIALAIDLAPTLMGSSMFPIHETKRIHNKTFFGCSCDVDSVFNVSCMRRRNGTHFILEERRFLRSQRDFYLLIEVRLAVEDRLHTLDRQLVSVSFSDMPPLSLSLSLSLSLFFFFTQQHSSG